MENREPSADDQFHDFSNARPEPFTEAELQKLAASRAARRGVTTPRSDQAEMPPIRADVKTAVASRVVRCAGLPV